MKNAAIQTPPESRCSQAAPLNEVMIASPTKTPTGAYSRMMPRASSTRAPSRMRITETSPIEPGRRPMSSRNQPSGPPIRCSAACRSCSRMTPSGVAVVMASSREYHARGIDQPIVMATGKEAIMNARPIMAGLKRL